MAPEHGPETVCMAQERYCVDRQTVAEVGAALGIAASTVRRWAAQRGWDREREAIAAAEVEIRANTVKARAFVLRKLLEAQNGAEVSQAAAAVAALERLTLERLAPGHHEPVRHAQCRAASQGGEGKRKTAPASKDRETGGSKRRPSRAQYEKDAPLPGEIGQGASPATAEAVENGMSGEIFSVAKALSDEERVLLLEEAVNRQLAFVLAHPVEDLAKRIKEIKAAQDVLSSIKGKGTGDVGIVVRFAEDGE